MKAITQTGLKQIHRQRLVRHRLPNVNNTTGVRRTDSNVPVTTQFILYTIILVFRNLKKSDP